MTDNPRDNDPFEARAQRAGAGLRSSRMPASSSRTPRRRLARRRAVLSAAGVVAVVATITSLIAVNRHDDLRVGTATTLVTTTSIAPTTTVTPSTGPSTTPPSEPSTSEFVPTTTPCPTVSAPAALLVADGDGAGRLTATGREPVAIPADTRIAFRLSNCAALVYERAAASVSSQIGISGGQWATDHIAALDGYHLVGVGVQNGHDILLLVPLPPLATDGVLMYDVQTATSRNGGPANPAVQRASVSGDLLSVDQRDSQSTAVIVVWNVGRGLFRLDQRIAAPRGDLGTRGYSYGVLDPTGKKLAFLDTPDWAPDQPDLVVRDIASGRELLRVSLPWPAYPSFLDYDGRFVVVSRTTQSGTPQPGLLLDTTAALPEFRQEDAAVGRTVTLDRSAP